MNSEQLKEISDIADGVLRCSEKAWSESLSGGDTELSKYNYELFERLLKRLNETVERFHMDNENEVTSERVQP